MAATPLYADKHGFDRRKKTQKPQKVFTEANEGNKALCRKPPIHAYER
jgi:hypothetical protein